MKLNIFNNQTELNEQLAQYVIEVANNSIAEKGRFDFVLTGGSSPKGLYHLLSTTYKDKIDWDKTYFFFGDERTVLPFEKDYNGLMAKESFFDNLELKDGHIFYVDTNLSPEEAAADYKNKLDEHFSDSAIIFDLILLGMGDDAHTASIFPHTTLVNNEELSVASVWVEKLNTNRVSLTAPLINQAKHVVFITFGQNKAEALAKVFGEEKDFANYPSQLISPVNGDLQWFVDEAAASLVKK
ncbi:6-phosphogluconolactonase [Pedobacter xixiisoli]|uniref:6-phosphogluconolactonase n=1 Tax=Pedobacter xixiisoli TaxID=1476464 RepID=A0A285ZTU1_9SPHI|nr:6-phosphogluconolactonase [Pedobacter xixiisoli]SOD13052.1 6-phosphogluconolactonase [Pedobacter xixiisoli]